MTITVVLARGHPLIREKMHALLAAASDIEVLASCADGRLPVVELGIIGFSQPMPLFPFTAFSIRDEDLVVIERLTGEQYLRVDESPEEVAAFLKFFDLLRGATSPGTEAEAIIKRALEDLR